MGFTEQSQNGMPYPLIFLLLPIVLHKNTRETLPKSLATKMHPWLQQNEEVKIGFSDRCAAITGYTREAILFGVAGTLFRFSSDLTLQAPPLRLPPLAWPRDSEPVICRQRARFVGKWLATAGDVTTIFATWGILP